VKIPSKRNCNSFFPAIQLELSCSESLFRLPFLNPLLSPEMKSHMTMMTMPMVKKLIVPTFLKRCEKYSTIPIFLISQYHLDESDVNSNILSWEMILQIVFVLKISTISGYY